MTFCEMHKQDGGCIECPNRYVCKNSTVNATAYSTGGWMNYRIRLADGTERRVYWRNHNRPYIKIGGQWIAVCFNQFEADNGETACEIPDYKITLPA